MNIFVGNLSPETTAAGLRELFSEFGEIASSKVIMDNATGMSKGFGFVEMTDKFNGFNAIDNLDMTFFEGNIISVKEGKQNNNSNNNSRGGGGGNRDRNSFRPRNNNTRFTNGGSRPYQQNNGHGSDDRYNRNSDDRFNRL